MIETTTIESRRRHRHRWFAVAVLAMICARAPLAFAAQSVQENSGTIRHYQLHGSGTTNPSKLIWLAMDRLAPRLAQIRIRMRDALIRDAARFTLQRRVQRRD